MMHHVRAPAPAICRLPFAIYPAIYICHLPFLATPASSPHNQPPFRRVRVEGSDHFIRKDSSATSRGGWLCPRLRPLQFSSPSLGSIADDHKWSDQEKKSPPSTEHDSAKDLNDLIHQCDADTSILSSWHFPLHPHWDSLSLPATRLSLLS